MRVCADECQIGEIVKEQFLGHIQQREKYAAGYGHSKIKITKQTWQIGLTYGEDR